MKPLLTERLIIRNWEDRDRDLFHLINLDETVMEFYATRRTHAESDDLLETWRRDIAIDGYGFFAVELRDGGECIGLCGIKRPNVMPHFPEETVEIGWRLAPRFWGHGYATEAANRALEFGLEDIGLPEIVAYAVPANRRSTAVMRRLGMRRDAASDFDHPRVPDTHPQLKHHVVYRMSADDWRNRKAGI